MRFPSSRAAAVVALVASLSLRAALAQVAPGESACVALRQQQVPGAALSEVTSEWFAAGSPRRRSRREGRSAGDQQGPAITFDASGDLFVVWSGSGPGDAVSVFGRRLGCGVKAALSADLGVLDAATARR